MIRWACALVIAVGAAACAGSAVRDQTQATAELIATARDQGAERCAPVELATAETHNDSAAHELDEGNYYDARDAADIAKKNAQLAIDKSPKARCTEHKPVVVKAEVPKPPPAPDPNKDTDGDGIPDRLDKCPDEPEDKDGFQDEDGCPDPDNDGDGFADKIDQCPNEPEDKDGWQDDDGCPDPDNDGDGIPDIKDKCPNEAGPPPDGCPVRTYKLVTVTQNKIELKQTVFFDTNKDTIKPVSFALLDDVGQALKDHPTIIVEIQGHTDSQGDDDFNMKLSQRRAESVRDYLMTRGITPDRMVPRGFGETVPIADNRTANGRSQNRRVEFVITSR